LTKPSNSHGRDPATVDRRKFLGGAAAASLALLGGPAAGRAFAAASSREAESYVIGIGLPFRTSIVYKPLLAGFAAGAKKTGATFLQSSSADNLQSQLTDLNSWIARPVNGITMFPLSPNSLGPVVKQAHAKGIKVVGYAVPVPGQDGSVTFDNIGGSKAVGMAIADWLKANHNGVGKIAVLDDTTPVARQRLDPAIAVLKKEVPGATIVAKPKVDPPVTAQAYQATQSLLQAHPDLTVIMGVDDDEALGIHQAVKAAGHKPTDIFITGMDGSLTALQQILAGEYVGVSGALPLKEIGSKAVEIPVNILKGTGPKNYVAQYDIVTNKTPALAKRLIADYGK
jgi:ribose transport system substrate-binding protein